jgi:hypothetical protein
MDFYVPCLLLNTKLPWGFDFRTAEILIAFSCNTKEHKIMDWRFYPEKKWYGMPTLSNSQYQSLEVSWRVEDTVFKWKNGLLKSNKSSNLQEKLLLYSIQSTHVNLPQHNIVCNNWVGESLIGVGRFESESEVVKLNRKIKTLV